MQSLWAGTVPQKVVNASAIQPGGDVAAATSANPTLPAMSRAGKCNWTEHTSPEGYKYYYNSTTGESKVNFLPSMLFFIWISSFFSVLKFVSVSASSGKNLKN